MPRACLLYTSFRGTLLPKNAVDVSGNGSYYLQYMFKYGAYADNYPNEAKDENLRNIAFYAEYGKLILF